MSNLFTRLLTAIRMLPQVTNQALRNRDTLVVFLGSMVVYTGIFLWAIGDLFLGFDAGLSLHVVDEPLSRMFEPGPGPYTYEGIAMIELGVLLLIFSPLNTALGGMLGVLVALNMALVYEIARRPRQCGLETGTAFAASFPALLAGSACCAPAIFLALGVTATGTLLALFAVLLPLAFLLLIGSLLFVTSKLTPELA